MKQTMENGIKVIKKMLLENTQAKTHFMVKGKGVPLEKTELRKVLQNGQDFQLTMRKGKNGLLEMWSSSRR